MERTSDFREAAKDDADAAENAGSGSILDKIQQRTPRRLWVEKWFRFLLQQYKSDEDLDIPVAKLLLFAHFVVLAVSITSWNGFDDKYFKAFASNTVDLIARVLIGALIVLSLIVLVVGYCSTNEISSKPTPGIYACTVVKYLHWYVIMPMCFMLFSRDLFGLDKNVALGKVSTSWLIILSASVLYGLIIFMRSQLPSSCKLNSPNRLAETAISLLYFILICANKNTSTDNERAASVLEIISILINMGIVGLAWQTQIFWWNSVNHFYMQGHLFICVARVCFKIFSLAFGKSLNLLQLVVFVAVFESMALKLGDTYGVFRLVNRMKNCQHASNIDNFILFFTYDLSKQAADDKLGEQIPRDLLFEMSQIGRLSLYDVKRRKFLINAAQNPGVGSIALRASKAERLKALNDRFELEAKDPLWAFYVKFTEKKPSSEEELFCYMLLQLTFLGKNIMSISATLVQFRKLLGSDAHRSFQLFLIESMFQGRLEHLSIEDGNTEHFSRTNLGEVMAEISKDLTIIQEHQALMTEYNLLAKLMNQDKGSAQNDENSSIKLDLSRVLVGKYEYLEIVSQINKLINIKSDIFSNLFQQSVHKSHYLYMKNKIALRHATQLDAAFTKLLCTDLVGNYVLATAVCYFLKVRFDSARSEKIFKLYQNRLSKYQAMTLIPLKAITEANFQYNSVIMRINIANESNLGMITDISPNYKENLGEPANNEPTKININSLFAGKMREDHTEMMKITADQPIFNVQKDFQMNGFDGYLRPVRYIIKLDPMIHAGLHSIALLRFKTQTARCLLLANEKLDLISAEHDFWRMMRAFRVKSTLTRITQLSESLVVHVVWTKFLRTVEITSQNGDETIHGSQQMLSGIGSDLFNNLNAQSNISSEQAKILAKDIAYNQLKLRVLECFSTFDATGIFHQLNPELDLHADFRELPVLASVENTKFGKDNYFRIWITFDSSHQRERATDIFEHSKSKLQTLRDDRDCKLTDSENKEGYTASARSQLVINTNMMQMDSEFYANAATYEKILMKAKQNSPIMTLLNEASGRTYPEDVKNALTWLENFYKYSGEDPLMHKRSSMKNSQNLSGKLKTQQEVPPSPGGDTDGKDSSLADPRSFEPKNLQNARVRFEGSNDLTYSDGGNSYLLGTGSRLKEPEPTASRSEQTVPASTFLLADSGKLGEGKIENKESPDRLDRFSVIPVGKASAVSGASGRSRSKDSPDKMSPPKSSLKKGSETSKFIKSKANQTKKEKAKTAKPQAKLAPAKTYEFAKRTEENSQNLKSSKHDASVDDARSQKTSVFSQLARNLFRLRSGKTSTTGASTSNFEGKEDLSPAAITKLAGDNALISHNPSNIQLITKYISDYKLIRKTETNPDEKNNSVSSRSTTSRGTHFLKLVNTVMDTKKGGSQIYLLTLISISFSLYFGIVLQYVLSSLKSYNVSNLNNFILLSNFIFLDRKLMESCETQDFLYEHTAAAWNATEYDMIRQNYAEVLPAGINSTDYLFTLMTDSVEDISRALRAVTDETINLIDKKDAADVVAATHRRQELDYTDRFIPNATIYHPWEMPYFSTIIYYMDIFRQNRDALIAINEVAWAKNNVFEMDSQMAESWQKTTSSKLSLDSTIFNKLLQNLGTEFQKMVDAIIISAVTRHFRDVYILLYLSVAVAILLTGYIIFAAFKINLLQKDYLMNYNMLRPWELFIMVEDLNKIKSNFTKFAYNEIEQLNQYLDFNLFSNLASFSNKVTRLQEHFYRDKDKAAKIKKFTHDFFFFSSKFLLVFIFLTGLIFGIMGLAIYIFLSINNNRIGVEMLLFDSHMHMVGIMKSYLSMTLLHIYGYYLPIAGTPISSDSFTREFEKFLVFQTGKRNDFVYYFGDQNAKRIDSIAFSNICDQMLSIPALKERFGRYTGICSTINQGAATKGIVGFFQYQRYFMETVKTRVVQTYPDWIQQSLTTVPERGLTQELFTPKFIEMRLGNWIVFNVYYYVMSEMATRAVMDIKQQLEFYVSDVMQYVSVLVYLLLVLVYALALRIQAKEIKVCYETFKLIDPFFLMNNRYLQFRFKAAYKGLS